MILVYGLIYEGAYIFKAGLGRVTSNMIDIFHIFGGYLSIYLQVTQKGSCFATWLYTMQIFATLFKLFNYFRVVRSFSVVTTMIRQCMYDLRVFLTYYFILLVFFGSMNNVLSDCPSPEYSKLPKVVATIIMLTRSAVGEHNMDQVKALPPDEQVVWWALFVVFVLIAALIFLNFIIAEIGNSYEAVKGEIDSRVY